MRGDAVAVLPKSDTGSQWRVQSTSWPQAYFLRPKKPFLVFDGSPSA